MKKLFAVIGDPISHSMSPAMHNDLFQAYGFDAHYQALRVRPSDLKDAIKGLKAIGISGFNVTIPHKVEIMPLLDRIDPLALSIGAVNTVVNEGGEFVGYNTDGSGYVKGLLSDIPTITDKSVLIIGAGGAARAIFFTMAFEGAKRIDITNRTVSKAEDLINSCPYETISNALEIQDAEAKLGKYDIVIQTTSIGMSPHINEEPLSLHFLKSDAFVSDIIYNPLETRMLQLAKIKGAHIQNGLNMFVFQGALAFERWTGLFPDTERMKRLVKSQLGGPKC